MDSYNYNGGGWEEAVHVDREDSDIRVQLYMSFFPSLYYIRVGPMSECISFVCP